MPPSDGRIHSPTTRPYSNDSPLLQRLAPTATTRPYCYDPHYFEASRPSLTLPSRSVACAERHELPCVPGLAGMRQGPSLDNVCNANDREPTSVYKHWRTCRQRAQHWADDPGTAAAKVRHQGLLLCARPICGIFTRPVAFLSQHLGTLFLLSSQRPLLSWRRRTLCCSLRKYHYKCRRQQQHSHCTC